MYFSIFAANSKTGVVYICAMKITKLSMSHVPTYLGVLLVAGLTLGVVVPLDTPIHHLLSAYAVQMMFTLLVMGILGFIIRNNTMILTNFLACIVLCSFLKTAHNESFTYSIPTDDVAIKVAHFVLDDEQSIANFERDIQKLNVDFLSIQTPIQPTIEATLTEELKTDLPYWQKVVCNNDITMLVFSAYELRNIDTLCNDNDNTVSLAGTMFIDSMHKEISFLSTRVPIGGEMHVGAKRQLASLSTYINANYQNKPLLTLSGSKLVAWSSEVQAFKTAHRLNDSRMDIGFSDNEHIFYSKDLVCTNFNEVFNGDGIMATYQFRTTNSRTAQRYSEVSDEDDKTLKS